MQVDVAEVPVLRRGVIFEKDMVKVHAAVRHLQGGVSLCVGDLGLFVQHLDDALAAGDGAGEDHQHHGDHHQGDQNLGNVSEVGQQITGQQRPGAHHPSADPHHGDDGAAHHQNDSRHEGHHEAEGLLCDRAQVIVLFGELFLFLFLPDVGLHHPDSAQVLLHHQIYVIGSFLQTGKGGADLADDDGHQQHQQRRHHQKNAAQTHGDLQGHDQRRDQHGRSADHDAHPHLQGGLHGGDIVRQTGDQRGRGKVLDVAERELLHFFIFGQAELCAKAHAGARRQIGRRHAENQRQKRHGHHLQAAEHDIAALTKGDAHIHDVAHQLGQLQLHHRLADGAEHAQQDQQAVAFGIGKEFFH